MAASRIDGGLLSASTKGRIGLTEEGKEGGGGGGGGGEGRRISVGLDGGEFWGDFL